jgi:hypothetical protein
LLLARLLARGPDGLQPRQPVVVGQRCACAHFRDVCRGMQRVPVNEWDGEVLAEVEADGGFAAASVSKGGGWNGIGAGQCGQV